MKHIFTFALGALASPTDNVEISCSGNELTVMEKVSGTPGRVLMFIALAASGVMFAAAWGVAILLLCGEISFLAVALVIMFVLLSIVPLNGIFSSSCMLSEFRVKVILEEGFIKYSLKNGLLRYSKHFDRNQSVVIAPVFSRGDWGYCASIPAKSLLKYLLPTVPMFPILTSRLVGSKHKALKEAETLSDKLTQFGIQTQLHSSWQAQRPPEQD